MAEIFAPLLSILIMAGLPLFFIAFIKNDCADIRCLLFVNKKSTVSPCLSTARYKYFQTPFTLMYVSSICQLVQTAFFLFRNRNSIIGANLNTHLCMVA